VGHQATAPHPAPRRRYPAPHGGPGAGGRGAGSSYDGRVSDASSTAPGPLDLPAGPRPDPTPSPEILLELVDPSGTTVGVTDKTSAHLAPGRLHRAFSVFLLDPDGRMLLQRRALTKYHSPGVWSNTCCGHPFPGEAPADAAARRLGEELGVAIPARRLTAAGPVLYRHADPRTGLVEHEYTHVFVSVFVAGRDGVVDLNPAEVDDVAFVHPDGLVALRGTGTLSVWFEDVLRGARPALGQLTTTDWTVPA